MGSAVEQGTKIFCLWVGLVVRRRRRIPCLLGQRAGLRAGVCVCGLYGNLKTL